MDPQAVQNAARDALKDAVTSGTPGVGQARHSPEEDDEDEYTVERADGDDIPRLALIERKCLPSPRSMSILGTALERDDWSLLAAKKDGEAVGHVLIRGDRISSLAVHPNHQRRGLGKNLVRAAEEDVAKSDRGPSRASVKLAVRSGNEAAKSLYESLGYEVVSKRKAYYDNGESAILMEKDLGDAPSVLSDKEIHEKASSAFSAVLKEWVEDPSPTADTMRWRNTETGEYRYQEAKPGEGEAAEEDVTPDGPVPMDELEPGTEAIVDGDPVTITGITEDEHGPVIEFVHDETGEDFAIYADQLDVEAPGPEEDAGEVSPADFDPMGDADQLDEGTEVLANAGAHGVVEGEITMAPDGAGFDYQIQLPDGSFLEIDAEDIMRFDGMGSTLDDLEEGMKVSDGSAFSEILGITDEGGLKVDYTGDGTMDDLLMPREVVPAEEEPSFTDQVSEAVEQGYFGNTHHEDEYIPVREIQHNVTNVEDTDLLHKMLEQEREGRNSRACTHAIEARMRALGVDPPTEPGDGVPEVRQGTHLEGFGREEVVNAAGYVLRGWSKSEANFEEWNQLLDRMTQEELKESVEEWYEKQPEIADEMPGSAAAEAVPSTGNLMDWEDGDGWEKEIEARDTRRPTVLDLAPLVGRMEADTARELVDDLIGDDDPDAHDGLQKAVTTWLPDAETREELAEELDVMWASASKVQFQEDYDDWTDDFLHDWSWADTGFHHVQAAMYDELQNENKEGLTVYMDGRPTAPLQMTDTMRDNLQRLQEESAEAHEELFEKARTWLEDGASRELIADELSTQAGLSEETAEHFAESLNEDGTVTVYRGVSSEVTSHGTLESWSFKRGVAEDFDGHDVMEAKVAPEDIVTSIAASDVNGWRDVGLSGEFEVVLPGGVFH